VRQRGREVLLAGVIAAAEVDIAEDCRSGYGGAA